MLKLFNQPDFIIFTSRQFAVKAELSISAASKKLSRLEKQGVITKITKGVWANVDHPWFLPEAAVPYLLSKEQGCVSFLSVLHREGVLSQIPQKIYVATTGHSRQLSTPVGNFDFIQMKPELVNLSSDWSNSQLPYLQASVEKALFDCLYIATRKQKRFARLPELELTETNFNEQQFYHLIKTAKIPVQIKSAIEKDYQALKLQGLIT